MSRFSTSVSASQTNAVEGGGSSTGAVRALIGEVQREAVKVRVDIASRVQRMSLAQLPSKCHPESKPTNKLATARAKAQKEEQVAVPFPYMDVAEFLPPWAEDVCIAFILALLSLAPLCFGGRPLLFRHGCEVFGLHLRGVNRCEQA